MRSTRTVVPARATDGAAQTVHFFPKWFGEITAGGSAFVHLL
jgi:hypothetical protein